MKLKPVSKAAQAERAEIIRNAEQAYRERKITAADLVWLRIITAKYQLQIEPAQPEKASNDV